jgi:hypothetical protein
MSALVCDEATKAAPSGLCTMPFCELCMCECCTVFFPAWLNSIPVICLHILAMRPYIPVKYLKAQDLTLPAVLLQGGSPEELTLSGTVLSVAVSIVELVLAWWRKERKEGESLRSWGSSSGSLSHIMGLL